MFKVKVTRRTWWCVYFFGITWAVMGGVGVGPVVPSGFLLAGGIFAGGAQMWLQLHDQKKPKEA